MVLFAWCRTASLYLDALADSGRAPLLVVTGPGSPADAKLSRADVPKEHHANVNAPGFVERLESMQPDLLLVAGWPERLGKDVRGAARLGAVNCHPSLLPRYRGRDPLFWAILDGEREVGITLHRMTGELDAGPILMQRAVPVPEGATSASLAELVDRAGAALAVELVAGPDRLPPEREQDQAKATHFPPVSPEHGLLDWVDGSARLSRLVRACRGATLAHCYFHGMKLGVLEARPAEGAGVPGSVLDISAEGMLVATADGALRIRSFVFVDREHSAPELASRLDITAGSRLTHNPAF